MPATKQPQRRSAFNLPLNLERRHYNSLLAGLIGLFVIIAGYVAVQAFAATSTPHSAVPTDQTTTQ